MFYDFGNKKRSGRTTPSKLGNAARIRRTKPSAVSFTRYSFFAAVRYTSRIWANSSLPARHVREDPCARKGLITVESLMSRRVTFHRETTSSLVSTNGMGKSFSMISRAELEITASVHSSRLDEAVCSHPLEAKVQQSSIICRKRPYSLNWPAAFCRGLGTICGLLVQWRQS